MNDDQLHREVVRMARELADKDREIQRLNMECTRLAQRNAVLVCEIDQMRQSFRVMEKLADILNSEADSEVKQLRDALYKGQG